MATKGRILTPPHLLAINSDIVNCALGVHPRIIITVPPRHGKSETTSRWGPPWAIGVDPSLRVGVVSYMAQFAGTWGRKARDILSEHGPALFGVRVREGVAAHDNWEVEATYDGGKTWTITGGGMVTTGIGGPLTGKGLDLAIVDDPVKNAEEAFSAVRREAVWDWFQSTLMSRLEPGGRVIVIMTRWHEDDLAGRLIAESEQGGEYWHVINYPAIAEDNDPLGRQPGEALWPARYDEEALRKIEANRGAYWFSAMYQQRPVPLGDQTIPVSSIRQYYTGPLGYELVQPDGSRKIVPKDAVRKYATVDLATSEKQTADFTVISIWGNTYDNDTLLLDVVRERFSGTSQMEALRNAWLMWQPGAFYIEATGYQLSLVQQAINAGLPASPIFPDKDKVARSLPLATRMANGKYYFPAQAPWLPEIMQELSRFPAGKHDDFVDTASYSALVTAGIGWAGTLE